MINIYWELTVCQTLDILCALSETNLPNSLRSRNYIYPHFIYKESETYKVCREVKSP